MDSMNTPTMRLLSHYLDLVAYRQMLISSNVANVDTPGYRTRDINFAAELRRAEAHLMRENTGPWVRKVPGLIERPDGNNVSLEREGLALAQTQLQFRIAVQLLRAEFRRLLTAINEGR